MTPSPRFSSLFKRIYLTLLLGELTLALSCAPSGHQGPVTPRQPVVPKDSASPLPDVPNVLRAASRTYQATLTTISEELSTPDARHDSTTSVSQVTATLHRLTDGRFIIRIQDTSATLQDQTLHPVELLLDSLGTHATLRTTSADTCHRTAPAQPFSPLSLRLIVVPVPLFRNSTTFVTDTLRYRSCSSGVLFDTQISIRYEGKSHLREKAGSRAIQGHVSGTLRADSTKLLPMHLEGTAKGEATLVMNDPRTSLASTLEFQVIVTLSARSSLKQQDFKQITNLRLTSLPDSSAH